MYFISVAVILLASLALIVQVELPYNCDINKNLRKLSLHLSTHVYFGFYIYCILAAFGCCAGQFWFRDLNSLTRRQVNSCITESWKKWFSRRELLIIIAWYVVETLLFFFAGAHLRRSSLDPERRRLSLGTTTTHHRASDASLDPHHAAILFRDSRGVSTVLVD